MIQGAGEAATPEEAEISLRDVANARRPFPLDRWLLWGGTLLVAANFLWIVAHNENFGWPIVLQWFTEATILRGLSVTLGLTVVAMAIGLAIGLLLAIARMSNDRLASSLAGLYIWFFRGTPLLVQLIFWYNLSTLFPQLSIAIPRLPGG